MKKAVLAATVISALLAGCSPFAINTKGYTYKEEDLFSAWKKVSSQKYMNDFGEYWESPVEFEARGGGDCEDFAFALVYRLGKSARAVCVKRPDGTLHEIVWYKDRFLEPQRFGLYYEKSSITVLWVMDYDETMRVSTLWGIKSPQAASPTMTKPREKDSCVAAFSGTCL